jgi:hypothetical protein
MNLKKGDFVRCRDKNDMVNIMCELQDKGIDTEFCYELNGKKGFWLEITKGADDGRQNKID